MKKRAMKKWIPKDTIYCYETVKIHINPLYLDVKYCPYYKRYLKWDPDYLDAYPEYYCDYCKCTDIGLLSDQCKICGEHEGFTDGYEYKTRSGYKVK